LRTIFHIDANSAYLSWTAADMLRKGENLDIRNVPSVIAGDPKNRHGIILAKSLPAKKFGIVTGESLAEARRKCPKLLVFPPDHKLYSRYSDALYDLLSQYSPVIQRYSVDECFLDYTASEKLFGPSLKVAHEIGTRAKKELGFTVNIGVSCNMLLAKMGSELEKPDRVHTLYPEEMPQKMWPLSVSDLFMVGRATAQKLKKINIMTIGDLANADPSHMKSLFKSQGVLIWNFANGIDNAPVLAEGEVSQKGVGHSITTSHDVEDRREAHRILLFLTEKVGTRLRDLNKMAGVVTVSVKTADFARYTHQIRLSSPLDTTSQIYGYARRLFDECWKGEPLRLLGVSVSELCGPNNIQLSLFESPVTEKNQKIDETVDLICKKYGAGVIRRGR